MSSATSKPLTLGEAIIRTLKRYGTVTEDFIAHVNGRRVFEVKEYINVLEKEGIIKRDGQNLTLSSDEQ